MNQSYIGRSVRAVLLGATALGGLAISEPVQAQPSGGTTVGATEEIIVTARRRKEAIQDVPIAITAFTGDTLREQHISSNQDLAGKVPSLTVGSVGQVRSSETFTLRGQGATFQASQGVVMYMAETPVSSGLFSSIQGGPGQLLDLENLQVLKGPQGTLFGRNTTGGAVVLEPARPTNEFGGYVQGQFGNYDDKEVEVVLNLPIVKDKLLTRFAGRLVDRKGFTTNIRSNEKLDDSRYWTGRIGITLKPSDTVQNYLMLYNTDANEHGTGEIGLAINSRRDNDLSGIQYDAGYNKVGFGFGAPVVYAPDLAILLANPAFANPANAVGCQVFDLLNGTSGCGQSAVEAQRARGPREVDSPIDPFHKLRNYGAVDIFTWDITDDLTFRNIASYSILKDVSSWDEDGFFLHFVDQTNNAEQLTSNVKQWTEEGQLQGKLLNKKLTYVIGGYTEFYGPNGQMENPGVFASAVSPLFSAFFPAGGLATGINHYGVTRRSTAGYAQGTYDLGGITPVLDGLKFTAGIRYTWDISGGFQNNFLFVPAGQCAQGPSATLLDGVTPNPANPFPNCGIGAVLHSSAANWIFGLDYKITPDVLVYAKVSKGYKAGGFNPYSVTLDTTTFQPEYNKTWEVGAKTNFMTGSVPWQVNIDGFHSEYQNIQRAAGFSNNVGGHGAATFNAATATIQGIEVEIHVRPFKGLELAGNYSYIDAKYDKFLLTVGANDKQLDCTGQLVFGPQFDPFGNQTFAGQKADMSCLPFQYTSKHQFSLQAHYTLPLPDTIGQIIFGGVFTYVGPSYNAPTSLPGQEPYAWLDASSVANFTIDWKNIANGPIDAQLFVTNAFDELYRISNSNVSRTTYDTTAIFGAPRMFGGQIKYRFGAFAND